MDPYKELPEPAEVENPEKVAARNINSATRQARRLKAKAKEGAAGKKKGSGGGGRGRGRGAGAGRGRGRGAPPPPSMHTPPSQEQYQPPYFYAAKQLGRQQQSPASSTGYVPYCVDVNAVPLYFPDLASPQLVRSRTPGIDQLGARSLFAGMSQPDETAYDDADRELLEMIHDGGGGCFEDGQVGDSEPEVHARQPGPYTQQPDLYTEMEVAKKKAAGEEEPVAE